jgi:hypothetical protein
MFSRYQEGQRVTVFYYADRPDEALMADQVTYTWIGVVPTVGLGLIPYVIWLRRRWRSKATAARSS